MYNSLKKEYCMVFAKIDYLNLLPFHIFLKRFNRSLHKNMITNYKTDVPSVINRRFQARRADAAFISSVKSKKYNKSKLGIIAAKEVLSVLVIPNDKYIEDFASQTSNALAKILKLKGEVIIGDNALKYYLSHNDFIDLAKTWHEKYHLPFVFAVLCYHNSYKEIKNIEKSFLKQKIKIPRYLLKKASIKTGVKEDDILHYLTKISYKIDKKASMGLRKFLFLNSIITQK